MGIQKYDLHRIGSIVLRAASGLTIAAEMLGLGVLFYLATFNRYVADDFCEIVMFRGGPALSVVFDIYMSGKFRAANRFSKFLLVDLSGMLGTHDVRLLPILMILLWLIGLIWIFHEAKKLIGIHQSVLVDCFMAISLVFFSMLQAPNLFQTFFWRSSSTTHFAPVVLFLVLGGFILSQIRSANGKMPELWVSLVVFLASFVIGGAGETPTVLMIVVHILLLLYFWQRQGLERRPGLILISSSLVGLLLALCALFFSPANISHGETSLLILPITILKSMKFTFEFIWDTLLTLPIPTLVSVILPGLLFFCLYIKPDQQPLLPAQKRRLGITLLLWPLLSYMLVAVTFAPSAYGQAYPVERARFSGRFLMTAALMFEGALLGVWFAQLKQLLSYQQFLFPVAGLCLLIVGLYPVRSSLRWMKDVEAYRAWASAWDERDQHIRQAVAQGTTDLVVAPLDSIGGVGEIKIDQNAWLNRCVADYYGLRSIISAH